ncbi:MAG: hypothetical protein DME71_12275 [Verrucomicrobia bacterium]|nr:MAG: hypothetical protein DME71_12275 [Verrucomicrobiota bacterium]
MGAGKFDRVLIRKFHVSPVIARIVFDCRTANDPARYASDDFCTRLRSPTVQRSSAASIEQI